MLLTYVDESFDAGCYWLAAVAVFDDQAIPLTAALDQVVANAHSAYGVPRSAELHGHTLFHGKDDWAPMATMARARIAVYIAAFEALAAHDVAIWIRGVDRKRLAARYVDPWHPHRVVLQHILEAVDRHAVSQSMRALVIADEVDDAAQHRRDLWKFQREPTPGYRSRTLTNIVDTIHFAPSHASRLLQAADLVAFLHRRVASGDGTDPRAATANALITSKINHLVMTRHCWTP